MTVDGHRTGHSPNEVGATAEKVEELVDEVQHLKHAVTSHATVDQAIGVVLALGRISPDEAWDVLREVSMQTNVKLRTVAEHIVDWGRTGSTKSCAARWSGSWASPGRVGVARSRGGGAAIA
ncbi:hypothetical protein SALBM135S_06047 [Streptomyces alboniger]